MAELSGIVTARGCLLMQAVEGAISAQAPCPRLRREWPSLRGANGAQRNEHPAQS